MIWLVRVLAAMTILAAVLPAPAKAGGDDQDRVRDLRRQGKILPLSVIVERLSVRHPGNVLQVELETEGGKRVYEIRMLEKGGVLHTFHVDAHTGDLLSTTKREDR